ncbi:MAG: arginase family protein [Sulfolobales archaeon]|jgi:agmatinase
MFDWGDLKYFLVRETRSFIKDPEDIRLRDIIKKPEQCNRDCVCVVGYPWDWTTAGYPGARYAPNVLRRYLYEICASEDLCICDLGDVDIASGDQSISEYRLREVLKRIIGFCRGFLVLGGDHSLTRVVLEEVLRKIGKITFVMFDAHLDLRKISEGRSSGTHLRDIIDRYGENIKAIIIGFRRRYNPKYMIDYAENRGIYLIDIDMIKNDFKNTKNLISEKVRGDSVYISVDADSLDPSQCPGVNALVPDGLFIREILDLIKLISSESKELIGADLVEIVPSRDLNDICSRNMAYIGYEVIRGILGIRNR